jgi:hypothetical protein
MITINGIECYSSVEELDYAIEGELEYCGEAGINKDLIFYADKEGNTYYVDNRQEEEISEDEENWYIDAKRGLGVATYPKNQFTWKEALEDQRNYRIQ